MSSAPEPTDSSDETSVTPTTASPSPATASSTSVPITSSSGSPTAFPPMTTQWTKPDRCTYTFDADQSLSEGESGPVAYLDLEPTPGESSLSCYPDGMFQEDMTGTFSPASCPNGWTTVSVRRNTDEPKFAATTTAVCCSSEFTLDGNFCKREPRTILAVPIVYNTTAGTHDILTQATSTMTSATLAVHAIKALFQHKDKEALGLTFDEEILDEDERDTDSGLSMGARIGIGIGATIAGLLLIGLTLWFVRRQRKSRSKRAHPPVEVTTVETGFGTGLPPPAYEYPDRRGISEEEEYIGDSEDGGEIYALRAQKDAIQRRIEELERAESPEDRN